MSASFPRGISTIKGKFSRKSHTSTLLPTVSFQTKNNYFQRVILTSFFALLINNSTFFSSWQSLHCCFPLKCSSVTQENIILPFPFFVSLLSLRELLFSLFFIWWYNRRATAAKNFSGDKSLVLIQPSQLPPPLRELLTGKNSRKLWEGWSLLVS